MLFCTAGLGASAGAPRSRCVLTLASTVERKMRGRARGRAALGASTLMPAGVFSWAASAAGRAGLGTGIFDGLADDANGRPKMVGRGLFNATAGARTGLRRLGPDAGAGERLRPTPGTGERLRAMAPAFELAVGTGSVGGVHEPTLCIRASDVVVGAVSVDMRLTSALSALAVRRWPPAVVALAMLLTRVAGPGRKAGAPAQGGRGCGRGAGGGTGDRRAV
jgi:hypothetical protein